MRHSWSAAVVIGAGGLLALAFVLPLAARVGWLIPPSLFRHFRVTPVKAPLDAVTVSSLVFWAGVAVLVLCVNLYLWWVSRPITLRFEKEVSRRNP